MTPRVRSIPSIARDRPFTVTRPRKRSGAIVAGAPDSRTSPVRPSIGSLSSRPSSASAPTGSPLALKWPPFTPATACTRLPHPAHPLAAGDPVIREDAPHARGIHSQDVDPDRALWPDDRGPLEARVDLDRLGSRCGRPHAQRDKSGDCCHSAPHTPQARLRR